MVYTVNPASDTYHKTSVERYHNVRAGFARQATSLHAWCSDNGVAMPNARAALLGTWTGPKATELVRKIALASGVDA